MNQALTMEQENSQQPTSNSVDALAALKTTEEKLRQGIALMQEALAQQGAPNLKLFWEMRQFCLPLFKESLSAHMRHELWQQFISLTREGRRLKSLIDEEAAFTTEQIDLAISALEEQLKQVDDPSGFEPESSKEFAERAQTLERNLPRYEALQGKLEVLNAMASRLNSLRKELIQTEMRMRQKNSLFQRLSSLGDYVFPKRKEYMNEISELFIQDVTHFQKQNFAEGRFDEEKVRRSLFFFRNEIKALQSLAKVLTLTTHAFSTTRQLLSQCWDQMKGMEKLLRQDFAEQKQKSEESSAEILNQIHAFEQTFKEGTLSAQEAEKSLHQISRHMRETQLVRSDVLMLKEALKNAWAPLEAKLQEDELLKQQKEDEFEQKRKEKVVAYRAELEKMREKIPSSEVSKLKEELDHHRKQLSSLSAPKHDKQHFERILKELRDQISEKEKQALLNLSEDDKLALEELEKALAERIHRRKEIKSQIEEYRKVIGGSGLDIEKAMRYNELMQHEKLALEKMDESIKEIKRKIKNLSQN